MNTALQVIPKSATKDSGYSSGLIDWTSFVTYGAYKESPMVPEESPRDISDLMISLSAQVVRLKEKISGAHLPSRVFENLTVFRDSTTRLESPQEYFGLNFSAEMNNSISEITAAIVFGGRLSEWLSALPQEEPIRPNMKKIYSIFHSLLIAFRYTYVSMLLSSLNPAKIRTEYLIGILTITLNWKEQLSNREALYKRIENVLLQRFSPTYVADLLRGLD